MKMGEFKPRRLTKVLSFIMLENNTLESKKGDKQKLFFHFFPA